MQISGGWIAGLMGAVGVACSPTPASPPVPAATAVEEQPEAFGRQRAAAHWAALEQRGGREPGSESAARAREYLAGVLREMGVEVTEQRGRVEVGGPRGVIETVNLLGFVPGASPDIVLLVAPYDAAPGAAGSADGSGAALLLELGRALAVRGFPYSLWLAFVEGDALARGTDEPARAAGAALGSAALASTFEAQGDLAKVRLAVYFDRLAAPDLRVARDLLSNRAYREEFWAAARRLGRVETFPPDAPFETVDAGQRALIGRGLRRSVALVAATPDAGAEAAPAGAEPAAPERSADASLGIAGEVSLAALDALGARLAKIDRFVASPLGAATDDAR
jgi:hypothetical protein